MNQKGGVIKRACYICLVLFSILGLMAFIGCGNGGGGGDGGGGSGEGTPTSFTTANLFPLNSSWQTDKYTLLVDTNDHDINGVAVRAMADTREPKVLYWTNNNQGLRLHAIRNYEGDLLILQPAILFANPICKLGDVKTGTYYLDSEEYNYTLSFVAVEDVTVPAGYFPNCARFELFIYPVAEQPSQYGVETFWLADGVGFVKGQADDLSYSNMFTQTGEDRVLLSWHITPSDLSAEEQALREEYGKIAEYWDNGELDKIEPMIHSQYQDERCRDKDTVLADWENFHSTNTVVVDLLALEEVTIIGDEAVVVREELLGFVPNAGGDIIWDWSRVLRKWKKDGVEWKYYGAHTDDFRPSYLGVWLRHETGPGERVVIDAEFNKCTEDEFIDSPNVISALTLTGPPGSGLTDFDLMPCWFGDQDPIWRIFWCPDELQMAVSGFYTFRVEDVDGDYFVMTDYLEATAQLTVPVHVSPVDGAMGVPVNVTLDWDPVELAEGYRVDMEHSDDGGNTWHGLPNQYPANPTDTQVAVNLDPDTDYRWRVRARRFDVYGEMDTESRSDWQEFATYGTGFRDQGRIFGTEGNISLGNDIWSQSITTGIAGELQGIQIQIDDFNRPIPTTMDFDFSVFDGGNPPTGSPLFSQQLTITTADLEGANLFTWDVRNANLFFDVGDVFTFAFSVQQSDVDIAADYQSDGNGYPGGELFMNGTALPLETSDMAFITYVVP